MSGGQLGFWAPVACPGRTGPIVHIVHQLSLGDLQPLDVGIPVVLLFPALLSILVVHVHTLCNKCNYCLELLFGYHITTLFVSNTIFAHLIFFISFGSEHKIDIKLILHCCINSLQRSLNSSYKVTSFITSWPSSAKVN